ncbi:LicD family protein [Bariatricus sp. SGI.154]|uniref:LicD family protein n=1 Tax=Bariatricus sp. SGI.154 TaxID=3420549 RepID=UPI003D01C799
MKKISLEEMQKIELDMLLIFDHICKKYLLRYYMDGGTLLGAMCYEGFIPWDDDIDLKMPRSDYEKLLTLQKEFPDYIRIDAPSKEHCEYTMLKLIDDRTVLKEKSGGIEKITGIYLDILPMDGHPDDEEECRKHIRKMQRYNSLFHLSLERFDTMRKGDSFVSRWKGLIYDRIYTPWKLYQKMTDEVKKYDYDSCKYVGLLVEGNPMKERFAREWLDNSVDLEFEGHWFPAPSEYKRHMEIFYGEHITKPEYFHNLPMILPDHHHEVYWKE